MKRINVSDFDLAQTDYELGMKIAFELSSQYIWAVSIFANEGQS